MTNGGGMVVKAEPEVGVTGGMVVDETAKGASSFVVEPLDPNPDLHFPASIPVFDEMRTTDGQVGSLLLAINLPILAARWQLSTQGIRPEVLQFVKTELGIDVPDEALERRRKQGIVWLDHLEMALLTLPFGFMPFEVVYEAGPATPDQAGLESAGTLLHLRKLAPRLPRTVSQIHVARDGGLAGISQPPIDPKAKTDIFIPVDRLVYYVHKREGADWSGRSVLRSVYKNWMIADKELRLSAQILERNGMGVPVFYYDPAKITKESAEQIVADLRAGATAGVAVPDGSGKLELLGVTGQTVDPLPHLKYHDEKIAESALAMFKTLGHDSGARSLGDTFVDIFTQAVQSIANYFGRVATEHVIRDLVELNFGPDEPYPVLRPGDLSANRAITTTALKELVDAGIIKPDDKLEEYMRNTTGLPAADAATARDGATALAADPADEQLKKANMVGTLIRSGFDPEQAMTAAGLDPVKHLGLLPVTLQPPAAGTDIPNAVDPANATAGPQASANPPTALAAGNDHLDRLAAIMDDLKAYRGAA